MLGQGQSNVQVAFPAIAATSPPVRCGTVVCCRVLVRSSVAAQQHQMSDNQCRMHHVEISAFADNFLEAVAEIAKGPGDALARHRKHRPDPGK